MKANKNNSIVCILILIFCVVIFIQNNCEAQDAEEKDVYEKVQWQYGPCDADIEKWAEIRVPAGYVFANGSDTRMLMEEMGNPASDREVGFFAPDTLEWFVVFEFDEVGYIKDDEKDTLDADAILDSIRKGTEESNKARKEKGFGALNIVGWEVKPLYNETTHNLEWAIRAQSDDGSLILNYNTRLLGRKGVMRVTLVFDPKGLATILPIYRTQLNGFSFKSGEKYTAFIKGDKIASYGLTALVAGGAGVAAAKFGLFKILAKFGKVIFIAILVFLGSFWSKLKNLFSRNNKTGVKTISEKRRIVQSQKDVTDINVDNSSQDKTVSGYFCLNCDYSVSKNDSNQDIRFCPECGDRLREDRV